MKLSPAFGRNHRKGRKSKGKKIAVRESGMQIPEHLSAGPSIHLPEMCLSRNTDQVNLCVCHYFGNPTILYY